MDFEIEFQLGWIGPQPHNAPDQTFASPKLKCQSDNLPTLTGAQQLNAQGLLHFAKLVYLRLKREHFLQKLIYMPQVWAAVYTQTRKLG